MKHENVVAHIAGLFEKRGSSEYGGEAVTQLEHALQAAMLAEQEGEDAATISAALLHDLGHVMHDLPEDAPDHGIDDRHEELACRWLKQHFPPEVYEPVELHVAAKRYLCAVKPEYYDSLSEPSKQSLALQGGPFSAAEVSEFECHPYFRKAIVVRRFDDLAKVAGLTTPPIEHFLDYVQQSLKNPSLSEA